jgi:hypothetical protein
LERAFPRDVRAVLFDVPHGCADTAVIGADLRAADAEGFGVSVTLERHAGSAANVGDRLLRRDAAHGEIEATSPW